MTDRGTEDDYGEYSEACCWNFTRDVCRGHDRCSCRCHREPNPIIFSPTMPLTD